MRTKEQKVSTARRARPGNGPGGALEYKYSDGIQKWEEAAGLHASRPSSPAGERERARERAETEQGRRDIRS